MCIANSAVSDELFEVVCERFVVEKDVGILKFSVESVFDLLHAVHDIGSVAVAYKHDKSGIGLSFGQLYGFRRFIILFWDAVFIWGLWTIDVVGEMRHGGGLSVFFVGYAKEIVQRNLGQVNAIRMNVKRKPTRIPRTSRM